MLKTTELVNEVNRIYMMSNRSVKLVRNPENPEQAHLLFANNGMALVSSVDMEEPEMKTFLIALYAAACHEQAFKGR